MKKLIIALVLFTASCTSGNDFEKAKGQLEAQGYTEIERDGYAPFCCSDDDSFKTGFKAVSPQGEEVEGCICSGLLKGITIRFD